jgi:hypothetical protein
MTEPVDTESRGSTDKGESEEFARRASEGNTGLVRELVDLIRYNKKWWLIPVIVALLLIGVVLLLGTTAAAPFIYPLF